MQKVLIVAKSKEKKSFLKKELQKSGFKIVRNKPDFVVSVGGDGTYLVAERKFPSVPKLLIRDSKVCKKCVGEDHLELFKKIKNFDFKLEEHSKIEGFFKKKSFVATNDIVIKAKLPNKALRFEVYVNNQKVVGEIIGDGVVISTPFGSTGYYQSITNKNFKKGIGVAFNNPTKKQTPLLLKETDIIKVKITTGLGILAHDNNTKILKLKPKSEVIVKKYKNSAYTIRL
ncbi:MAG: hypothetical protein ABIC91_07460 [Nanoarchaeota archaeon]|nr:NAD(+)/NADH kinase [Nanoarchaeota archaeon]MBU1030726.1 NAD(+)/NADH kinase [Nanoarchaeota archaeon]MBU1849193.1 NAD(+)/NADH kinase [Nanoarchaeota archaeon]